MSVIMTDEQRMIRDTARDFARFVLQPGAAEREAAGQIEPEVSRALAELGFLGMTIGPEWGGVGADDASYALAMMELAAGDGAVSTMVSVHNAPFLAILDRFASDQQKERFLIPAAAGHLIGCFALSSLEAGRIGIAAQCFGMAEAAFRIALDYSRKRHAFGKPIAEHQAVALRLADMDARIEAARQLVLNAARLKDAGLPCLREAAIAKLTASEAAEAVASAAIQTLGGYGFLEEYGLARIYRDKRVCQIYEGTSDVQRILIARQFDARAGA